MLGRRALDRAALMLNLRVFMNCKAASKDCSTLHGPTNELPSLKEKMVFNLIFRLITVLILIR